MRVKRRRRGQLQALWRVVRYRLIVPVFRSPHPPEHTARGVANGVFWALTPTVGLQTIEVVGTWFVARKVFAKDSSLLQGLIWLWINNPLTMVPIYYVSYVTGLWILGEVGTAQGYDVFVALWAASANAGWMERVAELARTIGLPAVLGALPYATVGSVLGYRWALVVVRRRQALVRARQAHPPTEL